MEKAFVILEGILEGVNKGNRFWTTYNPQEDPTKGYNGETWYRVIRFAKTPKEAIENLYK